MLIAVALAITLGVSAAGGLLLLFGGGAEPRYTGVARLQLPVPPPRAPPAEVTPQSHQAARPPQDRPEAGAAPGEPVPPAEADRDSGSDVPGPGSDGSPSPAGTKAPTPFGVAADEGGRRAEVALLVTGLGLRAEVSEAALRLPGPLGLVFSPSAPDLAGWLRRARRAGHEVLLGLPTEPADDAAGPRTPPAAADPGAYLDRLTRVLARTEGDYVGVVADGRRLSAAAADDDAHRPLLAALARRGLALVELGGDHLAAAAAAAQDLPYLSAPPAVAGDPSALAIDFVLAGLEAEALATGTAVGVVEPYPATLERLRTWIGTLPGKGLTLVPVTALLVGGDGGAGPRSAERGGGGDDIEAARTPRG